MLSHNNQKSVRSVAVSMLLIVALLIGTVANAAAFKDVNEKYWASEQIKVWSDKGYIKGYSDGSFKPDGNMSRAEFVALVNAGFGFEKEQAIQFTDVQAGAWYESAVKKATAAGYIGGYPDGTFKPNEKINRGQAAVIIAKIAGLEGSEGAAAAFKDEIPAWGKAAISAVVGKGFMIGYNNGTFGATKLITRAEAVVMLDRVLKAQVASQDWKIDAAGTYGPAEGNQIVKGNVTIAVTGVTLRNVTILGDLHITETLAEGDAFLQSVTVKGHTRINGGGANSVHLTDTIVADLTVNKKTGKIRIVVKGASKIDTLTIDSNTIFDLGDNASIEQAIVNAVADFVGNGTIQNAMINISGVSFDKAPKVIRTADGVQPPTIRSRISFPVNGGGGGTSGDTTAPILSDVSQSVYKGGFVWATSNEAGNLYLVPKDTKATVAAFEAAVSASAGSSATATAGVPTKLTTANLAAGNYVVYAVDAAGNVSLASPVVEIKEIPAEATVIASVYDLASIGNDNGYPLDGIYIQVDNIDLSSVDNWTPIGSFTGSFDGNGFDISHLKIDRNEDSTGLFADTSVDAELINVSLSDVSVIATGNDTVNTGGLVGLNKGAITNSSVSGKITGVTNVGGLVGLNQGAITNSSVSGEITGDNNVGGLAGGNQGEISNSSSSAAIDGGSALGGLVGLGDSSSIINSHATGNVTGMAGVGGLIGLAISGSIADSYATGNVTGSADGELAGGLAGDNGGEITHSYASGTVTGGIKVGGLAGGIRVDGSIADSYAIGNVTGSKDAVGGLVGYSQGKISNSYASGKATGDYYIGGLVGINENGDISDSYASGAVEGNYWIGGLVGTNEMNCKIKDSHATGTVKGKEQIGGLVGENASEIINSYASGNVIGEGKVGGLAGYNYTGYISSSYAVGDVTGQYNVGGLVGLSQAPINSSYASGQVRAITINEEVTYEGDVGGLVGYSMSEIKDSYAIGSVSGSINVGGLVGANGNSIYSATISRSYAAGSITGENQVGGLVGANFGNVTNSFALNAAINRKAESVETAFGKMIGKNEGNAEDNYALDTMILPSGATGVNGDDISSADARKRSTYSNNNWSIRESNDPSNNEYWIIVEGASLPTLTGRDIS